MRKKRKAVNNDRIFIRIPDKLKKDLFRWSKKLKMNASKFIRVSVEEKIERSKPKRSHKTSENLDNERV